MLASSYYPYGFIVPNPPSESNSQLHLACIRYKITEIENLLQDPDIDPNCINDNGVGNKGESINRMLIQIQTAPIHILCNQAFSEGFQLLLNHSKINVNLKNIKGVRKI